MRGAWIYWRTLPILVGVLVLCILLSGCSNLSCKALSLENLCSWGDK